MENTGNAKLKSTVICESATTVSGTSGEVYFQYTGSRVLNRNVKIKRLEFSSVIETTQAVFNICTDIYHAMASINISPIARGSILDNVFDPSIHESGELLIGTFSEFNRIMLKGDTFQYLITAFLRPNVIASSVVVRGIFNITVFYEEI